MTSAPGHLVPFGEPGDHSLIFISAFGFNITQHKCTKDLHDNKLLPNKIQQTKELKQFAHAGGYQSN